MGPNTEHHRPAITSPLSVQVHKLTAAERYQFTGRHYQSGFPAARYLLASGLHYHFNASRYW